MAAKFLKLILFRVSPDALQAAGRAVGDKGPNEVLRYALKEAHSRVACSG